jgi:Fe-S cluster assembly protein SufD
MADENVSSARQALARALLADHEAFGREVTPGQPAALEALRRAALGHFATRGLPATTDEAWRFTSVAPLAAHAYARPRPGAAAVTPESVARWTVPGAHVLVLVDGRPAPDLSSLGAMPEGARVMGLAEAWSRHPGTVMAHLGRHALTEDNPFAALNTAFLSDGAFVLVPRGVTMDAPVQVLALATGTGNGAGPEPARPVAYPRTLVVLEEGAQATVVETFAPADGGAYLTCAVTEVVAEDNAALDHYKLQHEAPAAFHMATFQLWQGRDSSVRSHNIALGAALARSDVNALLAGQGVSCTLNGLYLAGGRQHVDTHMRVEHAMPHGTSHELYKGILDGRARAVFNGRIYVHRAAQQTDAKQSNRNLLLSREALVNSNPQLEIFADDVKCTHGSTVGQLDADAVFYLRSRGIDEEAARSLLIYAFAGDLLAGIGLRPVREALEETLIERLPRGEVVRQLA